MTIRFKLSFCPEPPRMKHTITVSAVWKLVSQILQGPASDLGSIKQQNGMELANTTAVPWCKMQAVRQHVRREHVRRAGVNDIRAKHQALPFGAL